MKIKSSVLAIVSITLFSLASQAAPSRGRSAMSGDMALGFNIAMMSPDQSDINSWIDSTQNTGTKNLGSGYEASLDLEFRFTGSMFALMFRPSYFTQQASGGGIEAKETGYTLFPMLRLYPLESAFIRFFMQVGVGYGSLTTELTNNHNSAGGSYNGSAFGGIGGIGVLFCFTDSHCMTVEGNARYLPFERNTGSANGSLGGNLTQTNGELERSNNDIATTMSGVQGVLGYKLMF